MSFHINTPALKYNMYSAVSDYNFMKDFFKRRISDFTSDRIQWISCIAAGVLFFLHLYQFFDSGRMIEPLLRVIFCPLYAVTVFLSGRKLIVPSFVVFAVCLGVNVSFNNYTPFLIVMLACFVRPDLKLCFLSCYFTAAVIACTNHDKTLIHFLIHAINCAVFYAASLLILKDKSKIRPLNLTLDEKLILDELRTGKQQKEIEIFSQNTITKKLRDARNRNNIPTTEELLMRYIASCI